MKKTFQSSILLFTLCLGLTTLGFSSWVFTQDSNINIDGVVDVGDLIERNALTKNGAPKTFAIASDGIIDNETFIESCGVTFSFTLNNSYLSDGINNVIYDTKLRIGNINATIEPYFVNVVVGDTTYPKADPFPTYVPTVSAMTYKQNVIVAIDKTASDNLTNFEITYNFTGNFYSILNDGGITLDLSLSQTGWN